MSATHPQDYDDDPIWSSSRTARQIHDLGRVEKDIGRLLTLASSSLALLSLPQTDAPDAELPEGDERSEQFVEKVGEYFQTLDGIQTALRSSLAHIRAARISPAVLTAPPAGFVPPPQGGRGGGGGGGSDSMVEGNSKAKERTRGLLEERVESDAWRGALDALTRLRDARRAEAEAERRAEGDDGNVYMSVVG
ncbi:hypothetical protein BC826DRAFT_1032729 [Russula brevipes]|nr:hypothetical protein BC826DRAFT_1032729 [Russula brevipes]